MSSPVWFSRIRRSRREQGNAAAFALLVILPCVWWVPLLTGHFPHFMDTVTQFYPMRMAAASQLQLGVLPLWLPNIFSGVPLAANPQIAVWYPPQVLFYLWPGALTYGILCIFHYIWGGWGVYVLARRMTGSVWGALFGAIVFQFSAMMVSRIALTPHIYTIVWVPWMFVAVELALGERGFLARRGALLVALCFAMQILAGAPQINFYTALMLPVYWLLRAAMVARQTHDSLPRRLAETAVQGAQAALLVFLLSSIQLLPAWEFLQHTERSVIAADRLKDQALNGDRIWRALVGFTGDPIEDTDTINAIGLGAIALAILALARKRSRRIALPLWVIGISSMALSLGPLAGFWSKVLPLFDSFHAPRRALMFWSVVGCIAAGIGAASMEAWWRKKHWPTFGLILVLIAASGGTWWMLFRLERVFVEPEHLEAPPEYIDRIGADRFLTLDPTFNYSYDSRREDFGQSMIADLACLHGTHDVNGYDPLVLARYGRARNLACAVSGVFWPSHGAFFTNPNANLLRLLNVQYLVGRHDLFDPGRLIPGTGIEHEKLRKSIELVFEDQRWPLYKYIEERPLAWAVREVYPAPNAESALNAAAQSDVYQVAFVEEEGLELRTPGQLPKITGVHENARTIRVLFDSPASSEMFVLVSTSWMPGWSAKTATGEPLPTFPADGLIAGVLVPPGVSEFVLTYHPASFLRGLLLTLAGICLALLLFVRDRRNARGLTGDRSRA